MNEVFFAAVNAKAALLQEKVLALDDLDTPAGQEKRAKLIARFNTESTAFDPVDPKNTVLQNLQLMGKPSTSPAFAKLTAIAGMGS